MAQSLLYLTDLYYAANDRAYYKEDLLITSRLKDQFDLLIGHPAQAIRFLDVADLVVFRNTGPVIGYKEEFEKFVRAVEEKGVLTFNSLDGKADMKGKQYLLDLFHAGFPVIPTVDTIADAEKLGRPGKYIIKLKNGADGIGQEIVSREELMQAETSGKLIQPWINFLYEVSFYYLNNQFQYALYAPDKKKRWELELFTASPEDLQFAEKFISWNNMQRGITRVDACRLSDGSLLLVELEDLNPFLSVDRLPAKDQDRFIGNFTRALKDV